MVCCGYYAFFMNTIMMEFCGYHTTLVYTPLFTVFCEAEVASYSCLLNSCMLTTILLLVLTNHEHCETSNIHWV